MIRLNKAVIVGHRSEPVKPGWPGAITGRQPFCTGRVFRAEKSSRRHQRGGFTLGPWRYISRARRRALSPPARCLFISAGLMYAAAITPGDRDYPAAVAGRG